MSYAAYKLIHIASILFLFTTIGGVALYGANGGTKQNNVGRIWVAAIHGLTLAFIFISGFGLIAKIGTGFQAWVWAKVALWFVIGGIAMLPLRKQSLGLPYLVVMPLLGAVAAFLALFKPI
ncbi:MAG: hypothetical protein ACE5GX_12905 [Thermoanaerobaculia bacterium]